MELPGLHLSLLARPLLLRNDRVGLIPCVANFAIQLGQLARFAHQVNYTALLFVKKKKQVLFSGQTILN
jgi:hypothetical protein